MTPQQQAEKVAREIMVKREGVYVDYTDLLSQITSAILTFESERLRMAKEALRKLHTDCLASDFNEHWDSYLEAKSTLELLNGKDGE